MLLACGDSFTFGSECLEPTNRWSTQLSNRLGMEEVNLALPGGSNSRCVRVIVGHCLTNSNPDLIVMLWTFPGRQEYMLNYEISGSRWHEPAAVGKWPFTVPLNAHDEERRDNELFQEFVTSLYKHSHSEDYDAYLMYKEMQHLQNFCKVKNINYVPIFTYNQLWLTHRGIPYYMKYPWLSYMSADLDSFLNFNDQGYIDWCRDMKFAFGQYGHPTDDANIAAAQYLYENIDKYLTSKEPIK
jgi:hypothetical protein